MITENELLEAITKQGYNAQIKDIIKNGDKLRGLTIRDKSESITPIVYIDDFLKHGESPDKIAGLIINTILSNKSNNFNFDPNEICNPDYIKSHVYIGLQKTSDDPIIKRPSMYEGIDEFLYLTDKKQHINNMSWSIKLRESIILGIDIDELWNIAENRTFSEFKISELGDILSKMTAIHDIDTANLCLYAPPAYIVSNNDNNKGAVLACNIKAIKKWAAEKGYHKLIVLPSSIHEMILIPVTDDSVYNIDDLSHMVKEINNEVVMPNERLTDRAYLLEL